MRRQVDEGCDLLKPQAIVLVTLGFLAATVAFTWPVAGRLGRAIPAGLSDPLLNAWTLAWGSDRIAHGLHGLWTPPAFYPYPGALAYSENLLGISLLVAPVHWVGGNLVLTYNVAFLLSYVIAGVGMFLLARELTGRCDAALVAAAVYAFCPYRSAQVTHLQVLMSGWLPVALWALHRFFRTSRASWLLAFAAAFLLQALSNTYALVFSMLPVTAVVGWMLLTRQARPRLLGPLAVAALGVAAVLMPVAAAYRKAWPEPPIYREVLLYSADLGNYLQVTSELWHARWLPGPQFPEGNFFPGVIALALAALALARGMRPRASGGAPPRRAASTVPYVATGLVAALLSLGPEPRAWGHLIPWLGWPYSAILSVAPGFAVLRAPARFGMVVMLAVAVVAGVGASRLFSALDRPARRRLALALIVLGVALEGWPGPTRTSDFEVFRNKDEKAVYTSLRHRPPTPLLELPVVSLGLEDNSVRFQCAALFHRHPIINGMSRRSTPLQALLGAGPAAMLASAAGVPHAVELLRGMGVEHVVLHPGLYRDPDLAAAMIEAFASQQGAVVETWASSSIAVFRLAPLPEIEAPAGSPVRTASVAGRASENSADLRYALDGDVATAWTTHRPQRGGEWIELELDQPRALARLDLVLAGDALRDYPRQLEVESVDDRGLARPLYTGTTLAALGAGLRRDPMRVEARLALPENRTRLLRLRQRGKSAGWYWSINEIRLWEATGTPAAAREQASTR